MNLILSIGLLLVVGFFGSIIARKIKLSSISGYIILGILLSIINIIPGDLIQREIPVLEGGDKSNI